ncbi:MAG: hypothetical protein IJK06_04170 [Clostridia bacterium]|nr:hypothetical protein [Clostridia bacterium]
MGYFMYTNAKNAGVLSAPALRKGYKETSIDTSQPGKGGKSKLKNGNCMKKITEGEGFL